MTTIGVMSSVPYESSFKNALEPNVPGVAFITPQDDATDLKQVVRNLNNKVDCIVTLGGFIAYAAAARYSTKPFFSVAGEVPNPVAAKCWGGVSLESWTYNKDRVKYLIQQGYNTKGAISLYYNPNSRIARDEVNDWKNNLYPNYRTAQGENVLVKNPIKAMKTSTNDDGDFDSTGNNINSTAVIVSPDPFFHKKHNPLVSKLNTVANLYVCYPLQNYGDSHPNGGSAVLYGPKLEEAITRLAGVITSALAAGKAMPFSKSRTQY
jgi:hypothetical protein